MLTLLLISLAAAGGEIGAPPGASAAWAPTISVTSRQPSWFQGRARPFAPNLQSAQPEAEGPGPTGGATIMCGIRVRKADPGYDPAIERKAPAGLDPKIAREARCRE